MELNRDFWLWYEDFTYNDYDILNNWWKLKLVLYFKQVYLLKPFNIN